MQPDYRLLILIVMAVLVMMRTTEDPSNPPVNPPGTVTQVTFIYEKDDSVPPRAVQDALRDLNEADILASAIDKDVSNGQGDMPEQYKIALDAAAGKLPCLVVQAGDKILRVIEDPTAKDVEEAAE